MEQKKKKPIDIPSLIYGKVPPHSKELEETVLGVMMDYPETIGIVKPLLNDNDFYVNANQIIFKAIYEISENGTPDIQLVLEWLIKNSSVEEVGGAYFIVQLSRKATATAVKNLKSYCGIIKQKSIQRKLVNFSSIILSKASEESEDVFDVLHEAENELKGINHELNEMRVIPISSIAMNVIQSFDTKVYNARNNIIDPNDIYTGMSEWDEINGRLFAGVYVVGGRPGMGKGVHMTECICRTAKNFPVGVVNGEMTDEQLLTRIGCNLMGIDNFLFKKNPKFVTDEEQDLLHDAMNEALNLKIHIENNRYIHKIANKIKMWVEREGVKLVFADFLTLFKVHEDLGKYFSETQKVNHVLDVFVSLAKDLKIPIILYVQMNRQILGRHGAKEPNLADLKQSGEIEEKAYQVSFLHRPEYYDEKATVDEMGENIKGLMYQIIAKHRDGKLGKLKFNAKLSCSQLKEWNTNTSINFNSQSILYSPF